jgi:hypothetical protein
MTTRSNPSSDSDHEEQINFDVSDITDGQSLQNLIQDKQEIISQGEKQIIV